MKKIHQLILFAMAVLLFAASLPTSAFATAAEPPQMQKLDDGSYVVITIEYDQAQDGISYLTSKSITSGTKKYTYYDSANKLLWEFRVHGTFTYNGVTATATGASYSYDVYDSAWSFVKGNATYSGATATATGTFKWLLFSYDTPVSLTCSPDGVLS